MPSRWQNKGGEMMVKFRWYYDKDAEEAWLKKMSLKGWAFKKFWLGFYSFEASEPGEYNYQIDLLDNWSGDKKEFADFMEEAGVEVISQWYRWVYLRKKAVDGPFEMYTDRASKIAQYKRIKHFFRLALIVEAICFFIELNAALRTGSTFFYGFTILIALIVLVFLRMIWKCQWRIEELQREEN